jgi:hypothetical protein
VVVVVVVVVVATLTGRVGCVGFHRADIVVTHFVLRGFSADQSSRRRGTLFFLAVALTWTTQVVVYELVHISMVLMLDVNTNSCKS